LNTATPTRRSNDAQSEGLTIAAAAAPHSTNEEDSQHREAYEIFQRAHYEWQTLERHRMQDGLQQLRRAVELDPTLVAARVDLANLCVTQSLYGFMAPAVAAEIVRHTTATEFPTMGIAPTGSDRWDGDLFQYLPEHARAMLPAVGWVSFHVDHDLPTALQALSCSAPCPHDLFSTRVRAMLELSRHRFGAAIDILRRAIESDPFSPLLHARLAWALHLNGQTAESLECIRHTLAQFPDHEATQLYGAMLMSFSGETAEGVELAQDLAQRSPYFDPATAVHAYALACAGRGGEASAILERLQWLSRERFVLSSFTPAVHVVLGNHNAALDELRAAQEARCPWFFQMLADPRLEPLHGRSEFKQMYSVLERMETGAARELAMEV
jgi:tetratricopeptide (TPR) repeat protein